MIPRREWPSLTPPVRALAVKIGLLGSGTARHHGKFGRAQAFFEERRNRGGVVGALEFEAIGQDLGRLPRAYVGDIRSRVARNPRETLGALRGRRARPERWDYRDTLCRGFWLPAT